MSYPSLRPVRVLTTVALCLIALAGCKALDKQEPQRRPAITTAPGEPTEQQKMKLVEAEQAVEAGNYDAALETFRSILSENPTITDAYLGIGEIYIIQEDFERAEPVYERAARLEPRNYEAQYGHGLALQMLGKFVDAVKAYHRALTIDPESAEANLNIATSYLQLGRTRSALVFAEKAVEIAPDNGPAHVNLGAIYEQMGRYSDAIDQYILALEILEENRAPVMLNLVNVLAKQNRYQEAINTAENLIRIQPSANAYERLGWAYFRLGQYEKSLEAYQSAVRRDPNHWPALNGVGINALNAWLLSKKTDNEAWQMARNAFRRSLRINRNQPKLIALMSNYSMN